MIRNRYDRLIGVFCISALFGASVSSCSKQEETDISPSLSDTEIAFSLSEWTPIVQSRASLFERETKDWLNPEKGGGNFTLYAYVNSNDKAFINGKRGWYSKDADKWYMLDDNGGLSIYYWPNSEKLNFFAYMPDEAYNGKDGYVSKETYVDIGLDGKTFSCALPAEVYDHLPKDGPVDESSVVNFEMQEFIYAYETDKGKTNDPVMLSFKHPFAFINFKLKSGSYRMRIDRFEFSKTDENGNKYGIHLNGTFSPATGLWKYTDELPEERPEVYKAKIDKRVPNSEDNTNYNTLLSEWFVVMPQDLNGVKLTMYGKRNENDKEAQEMGSFLFGNGNKWEKGHKYIYTISYGNNKEEIYFNVEVEDWIEGYEHNIDVE